MSVAALHVIPYDAEREAFVDDLVGDVRGIIARRRDKCYGSLQVSDEQICELANAIVFSLTLNANVQPLDGGK